MAFKLNISDKGKAWRLEIESENLVGRSVGDKIEGKEINKDFEGYELEITGGSDNAGFPMSKNIEGLGIKRKRRTYEHGSDIEITQEITLEEAHKGSVKKLRYQTLVNCEKCKSLGHNPEAGFEQCAVCGGQGEIRENRSTFFGNFSRLSLCSQCNGLGQIPKSVCAECRGGGRVKGEREIALEIRPGISDGQLIKFPKAGESGEHGAENGDLYVKIRIKPHSVFERKGDDLYITKRIALTDILLEKPITLPTIAGGSIKVKVPHDYNLREPLVIAGEGMAERGNMFVILEVKTPKKLGAQAKKLLEELEKEL